MTREYLVVYEFANGSYSGYAPDLPGCISTGDTHKEIRENMREVLRNHVSLLVAQGNEIPSQVTTVIHCPKPVEESDVKHWIVERLEIEVPVAGRATNESAGV